MDMLLLGITVVSLVVALVMSVTAWRLTREEQQRAAARAIALSEAAFAGGIGAQGRASADAADPQARAPKPLWAPAPLTAPLERHLEDASVPEVAYPSGFLGTTANPYESGSGGRQRSLLLAAAVLFVGLATGLAWMMSEPRGSTAAAMGPNTPLELVSLSHDRQGDRLSVSGLVRNPLTGHPVERIAAVVLLFDQQGTFVTSATAPVDFLKLGVGDESPFVVSLDAPPTVARYRVSFRTDEGLVSHIDRRGAPVLSADAEQPVSVRLK